MGQRYNRHALGSSPPARGSSAAPLRPPQPQVVPARAGVFRCTSPTATTPTRRPRHARGSSADHRRRTRRRPVVPARAGVFRSRRSWPSWRRCRPRPRGGLPSAARRSRQRGASSPPARGSSADLTAHPSSVTSSPPARGSSAVGCLFATVPVVPARAGVFRASRRTAPRPGRPRPRGGLPPSAPLVPPIAMRSSPRARGSSAARYGESAPVPSSPPARGSSAQLRPGCWPWSSPPARGSSALRRHPAGQPAVVPARAGVFRSTTAPGRPTKSSPPARGWHPVLRGRGDGERVVPGPARGLALPATQRPPCCVRRRPGRRVVLAGVGGPLR